LLQQRTGPENLDILRFPADHFQRIFRDYLAEKFRTCRPGFTEEELPPNQFGSLVSGIAQATRYEQAKNGRERSISGIIVAWPNCVKR
jgi:hypothetical protein